jgi:hypothetical protein
MLRIIALCLVTPLLSTSIWAQTTTDSTKAVAAATTTTAAATPAATTPTPPPALTITGSADFYYRYNFDKQVNSYTSFTQTHNNFQLGMATVKLEHKTAKMDMVADLGFGQRARDFAYNDNGIVQAIKQLYISYSPTAWVKFTGGTWATHIGYEVLDAYANRNYSMSYMFTNGPFSHTGVRADFTFGKSGFMIGVSNPTDWRSVPVGLINKKNMIAQYSYAPNDNIKLYLNYVGGRDTGDNKVHQFDFVGTAKFNSLLSIGVNGTVNKSSTLAEDYASSRTWYGAAAYINLDPAPWFGLTLREEYFSDKDGVKLPQPSKVLASTLTAQFKVDGFIFMPEFRLDNADKEIFLKSDATTGSKSTASFLFAAIYSF